MDYTNPSVVSAVDRPRGCYFKGTLLGNSLFLAVNPLNSGNGGADGREAICKFESPLLPVNISEIELSISDDITNDTATPVPATTIIRTTTAIDHFILAPGANSPEPGTTTIITTTTSNDENNVTENRTTTTIDEDLI